MAKLGDQIGPYVLRRQLIEKAGVELWTADASSGDVVFVQLIHLDHRSCDYDSRLPTDVATDDPEESDPTEGQTRLRSIAKETTKLLALKMAPKVHAHGSMSVEEGHRVVYWGLELDQDVDETETSERLSFSSFSQWCAAFLSSLVQVKTFHESGYTLGHVETGWLQRESAESTTIKFLGLYVPIVQDWLSEGTNWHVSAPFESETATSRGDFWRIGQIFSQTLPGERTADSETLAGEYLQAVTADSFSEQFASDWIQRLDESQTASENAEFSPKNLQKPTREERMRDPVLSATPATEITDEESSTGSSARAFSEARTQQAKFSEVLPLSSEPESAKEPPESKEAVVMDPEAAAWASPDLPVGASPWSEIVSAAETPKQKHSASDFPGFDDELPTSAPGEQSSRPKPSRAPRSDYPQVSQAQLSEPDDEAFDTVVSGFNVEKTAIGLVLLATIFAVFFGVFRQEPDVSPITTAGPLNYWAVSELNEVVLDSVPSGAQIVSREDGLVLGTTPQAFLSPGGNRAPLFLIGAGHEAQSLTIPDRGNLTLGLNTLPQGIECSVRLSSLANTPFRAVGENIGSPPNFRIKGTAVVSSTQENDMVGARLVRCPRFGGSSVQSLKFNPRRKNAVLYVTSPVGVTLYVDGSEKGPIPQKIESNRSFVRLTIETNGNSRSWWVPMAEGAEVQLPAASGRSGSQK